MLMKEKNERETPETREQINETALLINISFNLIGRYDMVH